MRLGAIDAQDRKRIRVERAALEERARGLKFELWLDRTTKASQRRLTISVKQLLREGGRDSSP